MQVAEGSNREKNENWAGTCDREGGGGGGGGGRRKRRRRVEERRRGFIRDTQQPHVTKDQKALAKGRGARNNNRETALFA